MKVLFKSSLFFGLFCVTLFVYGQKITQTKIVKINERLHEEVPVQQTSTTDFSEEKQMTQKAEKPAKSQSISEIKKVRIDNPEHHATRDFKTEIIRTHSQARHRENTDTDQSMANIIGKKLYPVHAPSTKAQIEEECESNN